MALVYRVISGAMGSFKVLSCNLRDVVRSIVGATGAISSIVATARRVPAQPVGMD
jgi:predicted amino acid dehydrogenase